MHAGRVARGHLWRRAGLRRPPGLGRAVAARATKAIFRGQWPPLAELQPAHSVEAGELRRFREWALGLTAALGGSAVEAPSRDDLRRELGWLLEDAVAAPAWARASSFPPSGGQPGERVELRVGLGALEDLWRLRVRERVPLQYLTGTAHWRDLVLAVGPGALIPRPETAALVDLALQAAADQPGLGEGTWVDVGTGSGAIAVALARALPKGCQVVATDVSEEALVWARRNCERLCSKGQRVQVLQGSLLEPLGHLEGTLAAVVSNPPYIPEADLPYLQAEVGLHEPWGALSGGRGLGLGLLQGLCVQARAALRPGGLLALETNGEAQVQELCGRLRAAEGPGSRPVWGSVQGHSDQSLGQNFCVSEAVLQRVVATAGVTAGSTVLEIGPGTGNLTRALLEAGGTVIAVEKDDALHDKLKLALAENRRFSIVRGDVTAEPVFEAWLRAGEAAAAARGPARPLLVVGMVPYNITTPLLLRLLPLAGRGVARVLLMLQKEAGERLVLAGPGAPDYRAASVLLAHHAAARICFEVDRRAFAPAPRVDSVLVELTLRGGPHPPGGAAAAAAAAAEGAAFCRFVEACFAQRRKTLANGLGGGGYPPGAVAAALAALGLGERARAQELGAPQFAQLFERLRA